MNFFMINVADLVLAAKETKEYQFQLFDKIYFICRHSGEKFSPDKIDTYVYISEQDDLKLYLIQGELINGDLFNQAIVQNLQNSLFFDYFYVLPKVCPSIIHSDAKKMSKNAAKYIPGEWEKLVEDYYEMSLFNIK